MALEPLRKPRLRLLPQVDARRAECGTCNRRSRILDQKLLRDVLKVERHLLENNFHSSRHIHLKSTIQHIHLSTT